jgi:hypothetical protein
MATLAVATEFTQGLTHPPHSIEVILTGGGKGLLVVQDPINRAPPDQGQTARHGKIADRADKPGRFWATDPADRLSPEALPDPGQHPADGVDDGPHGSVNYPKETGVIASPPH